MRPLPVLLLAWLLVGCSATAGVTPSTTTLPASTPSAVTWPSASVAVEASQDAIPGPAGTTLAQEVGAVMMVGIPASPSAGLLEDWRQHQFGGLFLRSDNRNEDQAGTIRTLIESIRAIMVRPLLAATEQDGTATTPNAIESQMASLARALKADGFDIDLAPSGAVINATALISAAIAGLHSGGVFAAVRDFSAQRQPVFRAAIGAGVEMVMVRGSVPAAVHSLRAGLGFQGVALSDEITSVDVATRFLESGGDMVLLGTDVTQADAVYDAIHAAVLEGRYPRAQLDASVQKLLNLRLRFMP